MDGNFSGVVVANKAHTVISTLPFLSTKNTFFKTFHFFVIVIDQAPK